MYPEFWQRMLRYTNQMEDMCSFAQISRYFYRVTNIDFQKLCYKNIICRFEGETWATAFSKARYRTIRSGTNHISQNSISCPHTGFMALVLQQKQRVCWTASKCPVNKQVNTTSTGHADNVRVYDLINKRVVNVYSALPEQRYYSFTLYYSNGTLVDLLNQKEYEVETIKLPEDVHIRTADVFGYRKYVGFVNPRREFVVIHNETGKMDIIFQSQFSGHDIWLFDDIEHVGRTKHTDTQIYDINTKKLLFEGFVIYVQQMGIDGIVFSKLASNVYFVKFNRKTKKYDVLDPDAGCYIRMFLHCPKDLYYLPMVTLYEKVCKMGGYIMAHLDWSKGRLVTKYFKPDRVNENNIKNFYLSFCRIISVSAGSEKSESFVRRRFEDVIESYRSTSSSQISKYFMRLFYERKSYIS